MEEEVVADEENKPPLGYPTIRIWDLASNSTRWDRLHAAPADDVMKQMWVGWSIGFFVFAIFNIVVFLSILLTKKTRRNVFNQYLLVLMLPDIILTGVCAINCAILAAQGGYYGEWCQIQSFYIWWSTASDTSINAIIAHEIKHLVLTTHANLQQRRAGGPSGGTSVEQRYQPPTTQKIVLTALCCFLWAGIVGIVCTILPIYFPQDIPTKTDSYKGLVCMPIEYNVTSTIFWWFITFPLVGGIPLAYTTWITFWIWYHQLLPPTGKTREVSIFFFRIYATFMIMWVPALVGMFIQARSLWTTYIFGYWAHAVGAVTAAMSLLKADIRQATLDFCKSFCCWCCCPKMGCFSPQRQRFLPGHAAGEDNNGDPGAAAAAAAPGAGIRSALSSRYSTTFSVRFPLPQMFPYYIPNGWSMPHDRMSSSCGNMIPTTSTSCGPGGGANNTKSRVSILSSNVGGGGSPDRTTIRSVIENNKRSNCMTSEIINSAVIMEEEHDHDDDNIVFMDFDHQPNRNDEDDDDEDEDKTTTTQQQSPIPILLGVDTTGYIAEEEDQRNCSSNEDDDSSSSSIVQVVGEIDLEYGESLSS